MFEYAVFECSYRTLELDFCKSRVEMGYGEGDRQTDRQRREDLQIEDGKETEREK